MKLQFKVQRYQTDAVDAVVECFAGQPKHDGVSYRIDPGRAQVTELKELCSWRRTPDSGLRNAEIELRPRQLLENVHALRRLRVLSLSKEVVDSKAAPDAANLDIEMETSSGKTYAYIDTVMELRRHSSLAVRDGVKKSFAVSAEHFQLAYGTELWRSASGLPASSSERSLCWSASSPASHNSTVRWICVAP